MEFEYWLMEWRLDLYRNRCQLASVHTFSVLPQVEFDGSVNCQSVFSSRHLRFMAEQHDQELFKDF